MRRSFFDRLVENLNSDLASALDGELPLSKQVAVNAMSKSLPKKFIGKTNASVPSQDSRRLAAIDRFISDNERAKLVNQEWYKNRKFDDPYVNFITNEVRVELESFFYDSDQTLFFSDKELSENVTTGPGTSVGLDGIDTSYYRKLFDSHVTFSDEYVLKYYTGLCLFNRIIYIAEKYRRNVYGHEDKIVIPKLTTVPKNFETDREIMTQPTLDCSLQLSCHNIIAGRARRLDWFDLESQQDLNRQLAYLGSIEWFPSSDTQLRLVTVDLKSASNYPECLARATLPSVFYDLCRAIHARHFSYDENGIDKVGLLEVFSTMGCGYTFVVMTLILTALVRVLHKLANIPTSAIYNGKEIRTYAVFGDDIIIDRRLYPLLQRVLSSWGMVINVDKTFVTGPFRESCGADFHNGYPVRPVYCEDLSTVQQKLSLANRLIRWSALHTIFLPKTMDMLLRQIRVDCKGSIPMVPNTYNDDQGLHVGKDLTKPTALWYFDVRQPKRKLAVVRYRQRIAWSAIRLNFVCNYDGSVKMKWIRLGSTNSYRPHSEDWREPVNWGGIVISTIGSRIVNGCYMLRAERPKYDIKYVTVNIWGDPLKGWPIDVNSRYAGHAYNHWRVIGDYYTSRIA